MLWKGVGEKLWEKCVGKCSPECWEECGGEVVWLPPLMCIWVCGLFRFL